MVKISGPEQKLALLVPKILAAAGGKKAERAEVRLLPNSELRRLKRAYLRKDAPIVDVLSFPAGAKAPAGKPAGDFPFPEVSGKYLGEVYLNKDIARRDPARARFLLVHGVLHLLGFSHEGKRDRMEMEKAEQKVLKEVSNF